MNKKIIFIAILVTLIGISSFELYIIRKTETMVSSAQKIAEEKEALLLEAQEYAKAHPFKEADINEYEETLKTIAEDNNVVGMSVIVFHNEDILESYNCGYSDVSGGVLANDDTKYRIASISKVITTIGLMRLYDQGLFKLDDKIDDVIGTSCYGDVTFKELLTHTSGLYDSAVFSEASAGSRYSLEYVISNSFSNYAPGENYEYTNLGLASVGGIIERLTGEYFEDYMNDIFDELGIDASYVAEDIDDQDNIAKLYDYDGTITNPRTWYKTSEFYKSYGLGNSYLPGCGDLMISAKDLAKFAMALCNEGTYNGKQILSAKATELMLTDNFEYYDWSGNYKYTEGLSCHNFKTLIEGREIHGHTGAAYGVYTAMYFDPSDNTGVIILDNGASRITNDKGYVALLYDIANKTYKSFFTYK